MKYTRIKPSEASEIIAFLRRQFNNPDEWCDLDELKIRLKRRNGIKEEIVGIVAKDNHRIIGTVIAYRNPFSHNEWTVPIIAIEKGDKNMNITSYRNKGYGKALFLELFKRLKKVGCSAILTDTNILKTRGGSREFLESCGLKTVNGPIKGYFDGNPDETGLIFIKHL